MSTTIRDDNVRDDNVDSGSGRRIFLGFLLIVLLVGVFAWGYYATRPTPATVSQRDIVGLVALNGEVVAPPRARADVFAPFRAPVDKVRTSINSKVERGDVLVELSLPATTIASDQAKTSVREAERAYANAKEQYGRPVDVAKKQLDAARGGANTAQTTAP